MGEKGHIRQRGSKWCVVVYQGSGKYKWYSGFETEEEAKQFLQRKHWGDQAETDDSGVDVSFGEYLKEWLQDREGLIKPKTWDRYRGIIEQHIIPELGHMEISKLNPQNIQRLCSKLNRQLDPGTVKLVYRVIHTSLERAVRWGQLDRNPAKAVELKKARKKEMKVWNADQVRQFLEFARGHRFYIAYLLAITTGMRRGEILGLRWRDVDFEKSTCSVNQALVYVKSHPIFTDVKTEKGQRNVDLPETTIRELRNQLERQMYEKKIKGSAYKDYDLVVCNEDGTPVAKSTFEQAWNSICLRAGVPRIRFHDLRHTHASLLLTQNVHPKIVSERLGHSRTSITMDIYSHLLPGLQREAVNQFEEMLFRSKCDKE
jgi:integrase